MSSPRPGDARATAGTTLDALERLIEIVDQICEVLDAHRNPDEAVGDAGAEAHLPRHIHARGRRRVRHERAHAAEAHGEFPYAERFDAPRARGDVAGDLD